MKFFIEAIWFFHQLGMCSCLNNSAFIHYNNKVSMKYCGKPVSYHNRCPVLHKFNNCILYESFRFSVKGRRGFIKNKDGRICHNSPGNTYPLPLSSAQFIARFTHKTFITLFIFNDEFMRICDPGSIFDLCHIVFVNSECNVLSEGGIEE